MDAMKHIENNKIRHELIKFQEGKDIDSTLVRDFIYRSWQRCRKYGVDAKVPTVRSLSGKELKDKLAAKSDLIKSASVIMEKVFSIISHKRTVMVLADSEGIILKVLPEHTDFPRAGMYSREEFLGTCGIGSCIVEKKPLEIFGAEHWCFENHDLSCAATPILGPSDTIEGLLCVTTPTESYHSHTVGMLGTAAYAISQQLQLHELAEDRRVMLELLEEGILMINAQHQITHININGMELLRLKECPVGHPLSNIVQFRKNTQSFISSGTAFHEMDTSLVQLIDNITIPCIVSGIVNPFSSGMLITLKETSRMREFATRIAGLSSTFQFSDILGDSTAFVATIDKARQIASTSATVLLQGESGTGKELFAQAIHNASPRAGKPFVAVNCGALPRELVQSELFGYTEGAFTGASKQGKPGKFELADGGTIFLDEIGEMPIDVQVNLLRLIQNREVMRIGGKTVRKVNVRIIAATNKDLLQLVNESLFREDLYYRLNVFPIHLPPLRDRQGDIPTLARHFVLKISKQAGKHIRDFTPEAMHCLQQHLWPGNIRELENVVERAVYVCTESSIDPSCLPPAFLQPHVRQEESIASPVPRTEKERIHDSLCRHDWDIKAVMSELAIPRSTLYYKIKKYGIIKGQEPVKDSSPAPVQSSSILDRISNDQLNSILALAEYIKKHKNA